MMLVNKLWKSSKPTEEAKFDVALNDDQFLYLVKFKLHIPDTKELFNETE